MSDILEDLERDYKVEGVKEFFVRFRVWIFSFLLVICLAALLVGGVVWRQYIHNQNAALAYDTFSKIQASGDLSMADKTKAFQSFSSQYAGTGFGLLAAFEYAETMAKSGKYELASQILKEQTEPTMRSFFTGERSWRSMRKLALVKGGFYLLQARASSESVNEYFRAFDNKLFRGKDNDNFYRKALFIKALAAYENGKLEQAKAILKLLKEERDGDGLLMGTMLPTFKQIVNG